MQLKDLETRGLVSPGRNLDYYRADPPDGVIIIDLTVTVQLPDETDALELPLRLRINGTTVERLWLVEDGSREASFYLANDVFAERIVQAVNTCEAVIKHIGTLQLGLLPELTYKIGWDDADTNGPQAISREALTCGEAAESGLEWLINTYETRRFSVVGNPYCVQVDDKRNEVGPRHKMSLSQKPSHQDPHKYNLLYEELGQSAPHSIDHVIIAKSVRAAVKMAGQHLVEKYGPGITGAGWMACDPVLRNSAGKVVAISFPVGKTPVPPLSRLQYGRAANTST